MNEIFTPSVIIAIVAGLPSIIASITALILSLRNKKIVDATVADNAKVNQILTDYVAAARANADQPS